MPKLFLRGVVITGLLFAPTLCQAEASKTLESHFSTIHYSSDQELDDFFWRISGKRLTLADGADLVKRRVDELVERVEGLLEMYPTSLHFTIDLGSKVNDDAVAQYSHSTRTIHVWLARVTDGILAHEIAHAVINVYFPVPPPEKAQEILAQYVDKHLYNLN